MQVLLSFFVNRMLVAVRAELFEFYPCGCVATVFGGRIARNPWRSLVRVSTTFRTL
jgi:hypothetical protein